MSEDANKKWTEDLNRHLTKENIPGAKKRKKVFNLIDH